MVRESDDRIRVMLGEEADKKTALVCFFFPLNCSALSLENTWGIFTGQGFPLTPVILFHHWNHFCLFLTTKLKKISPSCIQFQSLWSYLKVPSGIFFSCSKFIFISAKEFRVLGLQRRPENNYANAYKWNYSLFFSFLDEPFSFGLQKCGVTLCDDMAFPKESPP